MNILTGAFHCFGCDFHGGDVIAFVMRFDNLDFKSACKSLGCWVDVSDDERRTLDLRAAARQKERERREEIEKAEKARLIAVRDELHFLNHLAQKTSDRLSQLLQGTPQSYPEETEQHWKILSLAHEDLRLTDAEYMMLARLVPE